MSERRLDYRDHLVGAALAVVYITVLVVTSHELAMNRDESFYAVAARHIAPWLKLLAEDSSEAFDQAVIARHWSYNNEHPSLMKAAFALSLIAHEELGLFSTEALALRFPGMLTGGLLVWLVYGFGARLHGRLAGVLGAGALALLPRVFYHAHLACFDVPIALMLTAVTYAYYRSLTRPRWAIAAGVLYGLALETKHNAWILPGVLLIHWVWTVAHELRARRASPSAPRVVSLVPWWLLGMVALGPAIFVGLWPWMWHDTAARFSAYASFHLGHEYYNMAYFGVNYFYPPFPVSYPFVMTAYTVPTTTLVAGLAFLGTRARSLLPGKLADRLFRTLAPADRVHTDVLFFGCIAAPLVVIALPSTPIFGGTKHWFPAYPFLAIYAGAALAIAVRYAAAVLSERARRLAPIGVPSMAALALTPAFVETAHSHPFGLSHYGYLAGGVPGAADKGMNRQFWGFTHGSLADYFRRTLPNGGTVWICDARPESWEIAQRAGLLPENVRPVWSLPAADLVLVHHEHHFAEVDFQAWVAFGSPKPHHILAYDGVPIVTVYANPMSPRVRR